MKKFILIFYLFVSIGIYAENNDSTMLSVNYLVDFIEAEGRTKFLHDEMILEVTPEQTSFYSRWQRMRKECRDSLEKQGVPAREAVYKAREETPTGSFRYSILGNYPKQGTRTVLCKHLKSIYYEEPIEQQNWELTDRDSMIMEYPCKMATCVYHGHKWDVWFTPDVPVSTGPWKLAGLPGLILKASDENGMCTFWAIGIQKKRGTEVYKPTMEKLLKSSRKIDLELVGLSWSDAGEYMKRMGFNESGMYVGKDGTLQKMPSEKAILLEEDD